MTMLTNNEVVYPRFLNNRPLCINGLRELSNSGTDLTKIYFHILDTRNIPSSNFNNIYLRVRGLVLGTSANIYHAHTGVGAHMHAFACYPPADAYVFTTGADGSHQHVAVGIAVTAVPKNVEIYINGVEKTPDIGNPNGKPNYNAGTNDWGNDGTTAWDTGLLDITSYISVDTEEHYIELKETGSIGGKINYEIYIV